MGEDDAEGGHGLRIDLPHEERVRQVVNAGDQHADDGRNGQRGYEMPYRSRSHPDELLFLKVGDHTLFLVAKVRKFGGPVVFRGKRYLPVMPDLIGHLSMATERKKASHMG